MVQPQTMEYIIFHCLWLNSYKRTGQRKIIKKNITNWFLEILVTFRKERTSITPRIKQSTRTVLRCLG